jgi:predicted Zn-dependent protease with MMP-like domain
MELERFEARAVELWDQIPARFREGVSAFIIEARAKPDPDFPDIMLMGECAVDEVAAAFPGSALQTVIYLYYGSFVDAAEEDTEDGLDFDWEGELWETITHELLHHLEWRAGYDALGLEDDLQKENLKRLENRPFDWDFYRKGAKLDEGVYTTDGDLFLERDVPRKRWAALAQEGTALEWAGLRLAVAPLAPEALRERVVFALAELVGAPQDPQPEARLPWRDAWVVLRRGWWPF